MKKKTLKQLLALCLCLCLLAGLAACGNRPDDDNGGKKKPTSSANPTEPGDDPFNPGNQDDPFQWGHNDPGNNDDPGHGSDPGGQDDPGHNDPGGNDVPVGNVKVNIYRIGDDKIAVLATGKEIVKNTNDVALLLDIATPDAMPDIENEVIVQIGTYGAVSVVKKESEHSYSQAPIMDLGGFQGTTFISYDGSAYMELSKPGLWNEIPPFKEEYRLTDQSGQLYATGKTADVFKTLDEEGYASLKEGIYSSYKSEKAAHSEWNGEWMGSDYNTGKGVYMKAEVLSGGLIHVEGISGGYTFDLYLEERDFEKTDGYISGSAELCNELYPEMYNEDISIRYSGSGKDDGGRSYKSIDISYNLMTKDRSLIYSVYVSAEPWHGWHTAPDDYEDKDQFGAIEGKKDAGDAEFFTPATDDYLIWYYHTPNAKTYYTDDPDRQFGYKDSARLYAFNVNGVMVREVDKYIFETEDDAKAACDAKNRNKASYDVKVYTYKGNCLYVTFDPADDTNGFNINISRYDRFMTFGGYLGKHYYVMSDWEGSYEYVYFSKPYTENEIEVSPEALLFWKEKNFICEAKDNDVYYLRASVDGIYAYFEIETHKDDDGLEGYKLKRCSPSAIRFHGNRAEDIGIWQPYEYDDNGKRIGVYWIVINNYEFTDDEVVLTQHAFAFDDPRTEAVTLDNYRELTGSSGEKPYTQYETGTYSFKITKKGEDQ
jgi:hypothetical protein